MAGEPGGRGGGPRWPEFLVPAAVPGTMPHAGALPDVTALGPYTYLATEVFFGAIALALLYRAGALRRAARTIAVLYPVAFAWDWYTLHVGVFAIQRRIGLDLLGIPIEEHVFVVVVPSLVLGVHETLHGPDGPLGVGDADGENGGR